DYYCAIWHSSAYVSF
nr:immunoglobulin light chain junction region [Macaca mulatta]MOW04145.1 immunoglobulin light chain junction region [Macaca mulatta]MOW04168.1 immunoglobulin light chain junction region [Macaca mulatta]MOW04394.1 immunoglobulin light chain junction region [Macaca mulatta]MOW04453.1 immunoglobulin light chain junction region [Macaca mulatta]